VTSWLNGSGDEARRLMHIVYTHRAPLTLDWRSGRKLAQDRSTDVLASIRINIANRSWSWFVS